MAAVALVNPGDAAAATKGATTAVATSQHSTVKIAPRHGDSWDW